MCNEYNVYVTVFREGTLHVSYMCFIRRFDTLVET